MEKVFFIKGITSVDLSKNPFKYQDTIKTIKWNNKYGIRNYIDNSI